MVIESEVFTVEKVILSDFGSGDVDVSVKALGEMIRGSAPEMEKGDVGSGPVAPPVKSKPRALFFPVSDAVMEQLALFTLEESAAPLFIVPPSFVGRFLRINR